MNQRATCEDILTYLAANPSTFTALSHHFKLTPKEIGRRMTPYIKAGTIVAAKRNSYTNLAVWEVA